MTGLFRVRTRRTPRLRIPFRSPLKNPAGVGGERLLDEEGVEGGLELRGVLAEGPGDVVALGDGEAADHVVVVGLDGGEDVTVDHRERALVPAHLVGELLGVEALVRRLHREPGDLQALEGLVVRGALPDVDLPALQVGQRPRRVGIVLGVDEHLVHRGHRPGEVHDLLARRGDGEARGDQVPLAGVEGRQEPGVVGHQDEADLQVEAGGEGPGQGAVVGGRHALAGEEGLAGAGDEDPEHPALLDGREVALGVGARREVGGEDHVAGVPVAGVARVRRGVGGVRGAPPSSW